MDILIKGIALPKKGDTYGLHLSIFSDGDVYVEYDEEPTAKAVALPEHGTLKDTDFIISCLEEIKDTYPRTYEIVKGILDRTPTVLEATE